MVLTQEELSYYMENRGEDKKGYFAGVSSIHTVECKNLKWIL